MSNSNFRCNELSQNECVFICNRVPNGKEKNGVCVCSPGTCTCAVCVSVSESLRDVDTMCRRVREQTCLRWREHGE